MSMKRQVRTVWIAILLVRASSCLATELVPDEIDLVTALTGEWFVTSRAGTEWPAQTWLRIESGCVSNLILMTYGKDQVYTPISAILSVSTITIQTNRASCLLLQGTGTDMRWSGSYDANSHAIVWTALAKHGVTRKRWRFVRDGECFVNEHLTTKGEWFPAGLGEIYMRATVTNIDFSEVRSWVVGGYRDSRGFLVEAAEASEEDFAGATNRFTINYLPFNPNAGGAYVEITAAPAEPGVVVTQAVAIFRGMFMGSRVYAMASTNGHDFHTQIDFSKEGLGAFCEHAILMKAADGARGHSPWFHRP